MGNDFNDTVNDPWDEAKMDEPGSSEVVVSVGNCNDS